MIKQIWQMLLDEAVTFCFWTRRLTVVRSWPTSSVIICDSISLIQPSMSSQLCSYRTCRLASKSFSPLADIMSSSSFHCRASSSIRGWISCTTEQVSFDSSYFLNIQISHLPCINHTASDKMHHVHSAFSFFIFSKPTSTKPQAEKLGTQHNNDHNGIFLVLNALRKVTTFSLWRGTDTE